MMRKRVCVVTGSRAEYGLLRWLMVNIKNDPAFSLQVVAVGMHMSPEFGLTYREIEADGFIIDRKIEMLLSSDTPVGIAKSMGVGLIGFADAFAQLEPDMLVLLGDRFEILAAATAAMASRIPIVHLHGGEATEGLIDEAIRHSVTKMSHFHFVAAEEYRQRVIQLGEDPARVFTVGGLGLDSLARLKLLPREALESAMGIRFLRRNLLITYHPVTLEKDKAAAELLALLDALEPLSETGLIFTFPNADAEGRGLVRMVEKFVAKHPNARVFASLGQLRYLSCMQLVDGVVGNSSSGLIEAPSLRKGAINIGARQDGRIRARSVIDCKPVRDDISDALERLFSDEFQAMLATVENPYGNPGASDTIAILLKGLQLDGVLKKRFYDLNVKCASS
jgi:GDP/UDP-N,N'-diacetylbacillosamine 2-epimerase (hydrolysing)